MEKRLIFFAGLAILLVIAFVVIIVGKVNKPPTAEPLSVTTKEHAPTSITLAGSDLDNDPLTYSIITEPSHGRLTGTVPNLNYSPEPDFNGQDSFTFEVSDGKIDSEQAAVRMREQQPPTRMSLCTTVGLGLKGIQLYKKRFWVTRWPTTGIRHMAMRYRRR